MKRSVLLLAGFMLALPANAAPKIALKCAANEERVWVYDDLARFDVTARLKCGDSVEILGADKSYVRVRTSDGTEGYVAGTSVPSTQTVTLVSASASATAPTPAPEVASFPASATPTISAAPEPQKASVAPTAATSVVEKAADVSIGESAVEGVRNIADIIDDDDDDTPDAETGNPVACSVYFSAYGLTPAQLQWFATNRVKLFPGVCPAPEPAVVDYVVIFTHDNNLFSKSMPETIHTDQNGFSDWVPVTAIDDTLIPPSSLDKAQREYAWVFRVDRGSFDPAKFSPQQQPRFTKVEHASTKAAADAFQFMAESGAGE